MIVVMAGQRASQQRHVFPFAPVVVLLSGPACVALTALLDYKRKKDGLSAAAFGRRWCILILMRLVYVCAEEKEARSSLSGAQILAALCARTPAPPRPLELAPAIKKPVPIFAWRRKGFSRIHFSASSAFSCFALAVRRGERAS